MWTFSNLYLGDSLKVPSPTHETVYSYKHSIIFLKTITDHFTIFSVSISKSEHFCPNCIVISGESYNVPQLQKGIPVIFLYVDFKVTFWILQGVWNKRKDITLVLLYFIAFFSMSTCFKARPQINFFVLLSICVH
jgi:hypothetical protein